MQASHKIDATRLDFRTAKEKCRSMERFGVLALSTVETL